MEYKDFPKNNKNEFVSLINCSSLPPLISHGIGKDVESCHDMVRIFKLQIATNAYSLILFNSFTVCLECICQNLKCERSERRHNIAAKNVGIWDYLDMVVLN